MRFSNSRPASPAMPAVKSGLYYPAPPIEFKVGIKSVKPLSHAEIGSHQVENELFKVAREGLQVSSRFVELYKLPAAVDSPSSICESDQVELFDIKAEEFTAFLKILVRP